MNSKFAISALAIVAVSSAHAAVLYDNTAGATVFTSGTRPSYIADDFDLAPVGSNSATTITGITLGFSNNAVTSFDMVFTFYKDLDFSVTGTNAVLSNAVGSFVVSYSNVAVGAHTTGLLTLPGSGLVLPPIGNYNTSNHGIEVKFLNTGTNVLNTSVTALFQGTGPTVGSSEDVYFRDANNNGFMDASDARSFGGGTSLANIYMKIEGKVNPVPEPTSMIALGGGALALLRRRRRS